MITAPPRHIEVQRTPRRLHCALRSVAAVAMLLVLAPGMVHTERRDAVSQAAGQITRVQQPSSLVLYLGYAVAVVVALTVGIWSLYPVLKRRHITRRKPVAR